MTPLGGRKLGPAQQGFVLIEVLVSALVITIAAGAALALLTATSRSAGDQRVHSDAYAVAQEDQARLRTMRISSLNRLEQTRTVTLAGRQFTVESAGVFVNNSKGESSSCSAGETSADYVRITTRVKWAQMGTRPPVLIQSIVSPSNGSLDPSHGSLTVVTKTAAGGSLAGVGLSASGAGTFSGATDANGCANFADLPSGNYTMTSSASGFVDQQGNLSPWTTTVGVIPSSTQAATLYYDRPGSIPVSFKYRVGSGTEFKPAGADSVLVYNAEMPKGGRSYGTPGGTRAATITATPLFPFKAADTVYAGSCESNNPNPEGKNPAGAPGMTTAIVPAGGIAPGVEVQVPALTVKVTSNGTTAVSGARVTITDEQCRDASNNKVKRVYTSNAAGNQAASAAGAIEPGLPYGSYEICASSGGRRVFATGVSVKSMTSSASSTLNLNGSGSGSGSCP